MEGYVSSSDNGVTVVLDTNITTELFEEGIEREIVSKIQTMRKEAGFEVTDRIVISYTASGNAKTVIEKSADKITNGVLANSITETTSPNGFVKEWDIAGDKVIIGVEKA